MSRPFGKVFLDLVVQQLGKPYVSGAIGPYSFDCSGLVKYCYKHVTGITIPHVTSEQWPFWTKHAELGTCHVYTDLPGPEALNPGDIIFTQFEGSDGHEMIYVGSKVQCPEYADPRFAYTYIQAPQTGDVVKKSEFIWGKKDTAQGGARGIRFGRFVQTKWPPGMEPVDPEEDEMNIAPLEVTKMPNQGDLRVYHITESLVSWKWAKELEEWLTMDNENKDKVIKPQVTIVGSNGKSALVLFPELGGWKREAIKISDNAKAAGIDVGFTIIVKIPGDDNVSIAATIFAR